MSEVMNVGSLAFDVTDRLHKSMRVSGLSSGKLADALGVHRNTISNYLAGRTPVDRRTMIAWAFATGVPVTWLEHGSVPDGGPDDGGAVTGLYPASVRDPALVLLTAA